MQFLQYQKLFPLKPLFEPESLLRIDMHDISRLKEKEFVKLALEELDKVCSENFSNSFKDGLLKHAKAGIQKRPTPTERKRERRAVLRECRNAINRQFADTAAKTVLTEDESVSSYQRKRLSQSFKKPPAPKRLKSHSPNFDRVEWDKEKVIADLKEYPTDKLINWSQFAREHGVPGSNGGQVVKQYAHKNSINTQALETTDHQTGGYNLSISVCLVERYHYHLIPPQRALKNHGMIQSNLVSFLSVNHVHHTLSQGMIQRKGLSRPQMSRYMAENFPY